MWLISIAGPKNLQTRTALPCRAVAVWKFEKKKKGAHSIIRIVFKKLDNKSLVDKCNFVTYNLLGKL